MSDTNATIENKTANANSGCLSRLVRCVWCRRVMTTGVRWDRHPDAPCCSTLCAKLAEQSAAQAASTWADYLREVAAELEATNKEVSSK